MTRELWARVDEQLQALMQLPAAQRQEFLQTSCHDDEGVRRELESLLQAHDRAAGFLETPAIAVEARTMAAASQFEVGDTVGSYTIVSRLGAGGMGDVYRAHDARLGRDVAIKVLLEHSIGDLNGVEQITREARAASALNHPSVLTVHQIGEHEGVPFIVMEFVDGETLRAHIAAAPLPMSSTLGIAIQIAEALSAAHQAGIVHGDVKPENVMIRADGFVKLLDFGMASRPHSEAAAEASPRHGRAGTTRYMSPEQVRGEILDPRTDIFSLGVVLREMMSGSIPPAFESVVHKALATERDQRYQSAQHLLVDLRQLQRDLERSPLSGRTIAAFTAGSLAIFVTVAILFGPTSPSPVARITPLTSNGTAVAAAISPDGRYVAYVTDQGGKRNISLRELATSRVAAVEALPNEQYIDLHFSRDGHSLYHVVRDEQTWLYRSRLDGHDARRVTAGFIGNVTFSPDGGQAAIVRIKPPDHFVLTLVDIDKNTERPLLARKMGPDTIGSVTWSPDGKLIAYTSGEPGNASSGRLVTVEVGTGIERPLPIRPGQLFRSPSWVPNGKGFILAALDRTVGPGYQLWHVNYPDGDQRKVTNDLQNYRGVSFAGDSSAFVTLQESVSLRLWTTPLGEPGRATPVASREGRDDGQVGLAWTPEGRIVYTSTAADATDLWIMDADGRNRRALTSGGKRNMLPSVSPDGRYVVYVSNRGGPYGIWRMSLSGGDVKHVAAANGNVRPHVSPDGKWVFYHRIVGNDPPTLLKVSIDGGVPEQFTDRHSRNAVVSPNGTLLAYTYLAPDGRGPQAAIVPVGGGLPIMTIAVSALLVRWTPDGHALSFIKTDRGVSNIWKTPLDGGPSVPVTAFDADQIHQFDWSHDGRLVVSRGATSRDVVMISGFR